MQASQVNVKFIPRPEDQTDFFKVLRVRVEDYFKQTNQSKQANLPMYIKTGVMLALYFVPLMLMLAGVITEVGTMMLMWVIMAMGIAGIGFSVMHDANHGAYSSNKQLNQALGFLLNFLGGYHINWRIQHNVLHHTYPNIAGHDDDIHKPLIFRMSPDQPYKPSYRFQAYYAVFFYGLMSIYWVMVKDFEQVVDYGKRGLLKRENLSLSQALTQMTFHKVWYFVLVLVLPMIVLPIAWYWVIAGFLLMLVLSGLMLSLVFQCAHVLEETHFTVPNEEGRIESNWAVHQLRTTANFAENSVLFSWFIGGLNFQIEHHLFPHICHIHYPRLAPIVKATAAEYGIPYHQHRTFTSALKSHFMQLNRLGKGSV